jgi:hypothetical protein
MLLVPPKAGAQASTIRMPHHRPLIGLFEGSSWFSRRGNASAKD